MVSPLRSAICYLAMFSGTAILCFAQAPAKKAASPSPAQTNAEAKKADPKSAKVTSPLAFKDVLQLRQKMQPDDVLGQALARGIDFELTKPQMAQLGKLGFTVAQLENLQSAHGIEPLPPIVPGQHLLENEAQRDELFKKFEQITKETAPDLVPIETPHITLWAPKPLQNNVMVVLKKLDMLLETKFQEPIRSGLDKRTCHIVLLRNQAEALAWFDKYYDIMMVQNDDPDGKDGFLKRCTNGAMTDRACVLNLASIQPQKLMNHLGVYVGYMALKQLSGYNKTDPLVTGFANGIEGVLVGIPETPIVSRSYGTEDKNPNGGGKAWPLIAKQRLATGKLTPPSALLKLTTANMDMPEFVESWTLIDLLVRDRVKFGKLVYKLREEPDGLKAIEEIYGWNEAELAKQWQLHVAK